VRRALTWLAGVVGLATLARLLRKRAAGTEPRTDPADALRERLAAQRRQAGSPSTDVVVAPESEPERTGPPNAIDLEERRARVHARAQEAIELMSDGPSDVGPESDATA
jgi:hypothetical protein